MKKQFELGIFQPHRKNGPKCAICYEPLQGGEEAEGPPEEPAPVVQQAGFGLPSWSVWIALGIAGYFGLKHFKVIK